MPHAIYLVGTSMRSFFVDELEKIGYNQERVHMFETSKELGEQLLADIPLRQKTSVVLFKWSQNTIFMEEAIKPLLKNKDDVKKLCRQSSRRLKRKFA